MVLKRGTASGSSSGGSTAGNGHHTDDVVALVALLVIVLGVGGYLVRTRLAAITRALDRRQWLSGAAVACAAVVPVAVLLSSGSSAVHRSQAQLLAADPSVDPGTAISAPAPGLTLTDQFGRPASLSQYRGKVVILAFDDSECTTVCPLTTEAMRQAKAMLGRAGSGCSYSGSTPTRTRSRSRTSSPTPSSHGMGHAWRFLTGSLPELEAGVERVSRRGRRSREARSSTRPRCS